MFFYIKIYDKGMCSIKKKFLFFCENLIKKNTNINNSDKLDQIKYGLEGIYLTITKMIILTIISIFLGIFKEFILIILLFNCIRFFAFGLHLNNSINCLFASGLLIIGSTLCAKYLTIPFEIKVLILIISFLLIFIYAPADTKKRPIISKKKRRRLKTFSILVVIIYSIVILNVNNAVISNCFLLSTLIEILLILPISYRIFGFSYNNYKKYNL
jgi:accessory gene regulator B